MGGKLGKKQLPDTDEKPKDQKRDGATTEMEDPTGDKGVSSSGPEILQGEGSNQVSQLHADADKSKEGDAVPCIEGVKKADSPINVAAETDGPGEVPLPVPLMVPEASNEAEVAKSLVIPEETEKGSAVVTPPKH